MNGQHTIILHCGPAIRSALIKYMAKNDLDKEFAGLCLLSKSLRSEGFLSEDDYKESIHRYNRPVYKMVEPRQLTHEELNEKQKVDEKTRVFRMVLDQWYYKDHRPGWKHSWIEEAKEWPMIAEAIKIIQLGDATEMFVTQKPTVAGEKKNDEPTT